MVIDDSSTIRIAERKILLSENFEVILEADGAMDALTKLREAVDKPDIIMMDFEMPQMNGIDLLKRIRALNIDAKIIVVTSYANKGVLMEFLKLKVDGYVVKPVQRRNDSDAGEMQPEMIGRVVLKCVCLVEQHDAVIRQQ